MEEKYLEIARKYLCDTKEGLNKSICITIKISDIDNAEDKEKFIKRKLKLHHINSVWQLSIQTNME